MNKEMKIALLQPDLIWKDKVKNLNNMEKLIASIGKPVDIIALPEMFTTAFCVDDSSLAEGMEGGTVQWMKGMARRRNAAICGSILFEEAGHLYNRFLWVEADGKLTSYDKHHLFSLVGENNLLSKGMHKTVIDYKGWTIQPFVCYDLRFPAWCQNDDNADIQLYAANWPKKRIHHWKHLLQARAIENQCYVVGVNRTGTDYFGNEHDGCSSVYDYAGNRITCIEGRNGTEIVKLSKQNLEKHKERYPFWKDRDTFMPPL